MKLLQVWGSIEKRHVTAITIIYECLYAVACRVHLLDGAMVSPTKDVYSVFGLTFYSRYPSGGEEKDVGGGEEENVGNPNDEDDNDKDEWFTNFSL